MRFIIVDNRQFLPRDGRLNTVIGILKEIAVLGCTTSWTHFGMTIVGENMFTNVLHLQEMKHLSLTALNNAFGEAVKIISNNAASNLTEKKQKLLSNISSALQNTMKQFKELKGKKDKEILITILTVCWDGKVEQEFGEFYCSSRDSSNVQIQVIEIANEKFLITKNSVVSDKVHVHSLPINGLEIAMEAVCKGWAKMGSLELKFNFLNCDGPEIVVKAEELFVDLRPQSDLPQSLTITSVANQIDLCRSYSHGRCLMLSASDTNASNSYRWEALCKLAQNNDTIIVAKENNALATYALIPCDDLRMLMQPMACVELQLPKSEPNACELISEDFEQLTQKIQSTDEYGFGPKADTIQYLKEKWTKNFPTETISKLNQPTKKPQNNPGQIRKAANSNSLAHPALGMYPSKK
uniref:Uncharacterized protein n=1 Tax=Daphnia galeata TaxID=27404 RepID=A0A8J2RUF2_9CRUS|nr:unnamed protein product [Daphnia galeata]